MITYLKVRNLAIVEELAIEPGPGLNVLTGETGAGKSLLIDSLEFLRGARGSTEMIRGGSDRMTAEAVFHLPATLRPQLEELGIETESGDLELIVRREIAATGRGRVLVNGSPLAVRELGAAMDAVLEIHGQHESNSRVAGQGYRELVDEYGGHDLLVEDTRTAYREWKIAADQLREMSDAQRDRTLRLDLLKYQLDEISAAKLDPTEKEALRGDKVILSHAREMIEATSGAYQLLDDDESSAIVQLGRALHLLQPLSRQIDEIRRIADDLQDALYRVQDLGRTLSNLSESTRHDPARLDQIEDRLVTIERLEKKYGGSIEAVLEHLGRIQDEHERLVDFESSLEKLQTAEATRLAAYRKNADKLSTARKKAARAFEQAIQKELNDLAMERTTVRVAVEREETAREHGLDRVEILIAPNRGEEPKAMQRIASGGELSRIQLAIAAALFKASTRAAEATLVFDEIDAGIGGRVAEVVGRKLQELSARNQVVCVTHLPQIAGFGAIHFYVWKEDAAGHTRARIRRLDSEEERVQEIARMLGGEKISASAVAHARELLQSAERRGQKHDATSPLPLSPRRAGRGWREAPGEGACHVRGTAPHPNPLPTQKARGERGLSSKHPLIMRRWHIGDAPTSLQLKQIADALASGAVVLMPTDTIYGLHAVAADDEAVARIAEMKGRDETKPFIVLASSVAQFPDLGITARPEVVQALAAIWPAPLTAILPRGEKTLAVRIPALEWLRGLVERTGPLVSTSANRSGEPAVDRPETLARDLQNRIDVVDGGVRTGEPSAILDLTSDEPRFIREGNASFTQNVWKTLRNSL